jgi:quinol monooxygenase YgiN
MTMMAASAQVALGQSAPAYGVTYIEVMPAASGKALTMLRALCAASRKSDGSVRFEARQGRDRPHQFAIIEIWQDTATFEAALASSSRKTFREQIQPLLAAGYDERPHSGLAVAGAAGALAATAATCLR